MSLKRFLFLLLLGAAGAAALRYFLFEGIYIASPSMEPTLPVGRHLILDKTAYLFSGPRRGDVVSFRSPVPPRKEMVKRVIAVAGESVEIRAKKVFIDGEELEEDYVQHTRAGERLAGDDLGPLTVPDDELFVLGDNRDESNDSSAWKDEDGNRVYFVPVKEVRGRIRGVY